MTKMKRIEVPYIDQSIRYPTGCESVSAVMLLRFLGYPVTVDSFIDEALDTENFEMRDGELYGPDPMKSFCGSPYDADSFGCYAPVICRALDRVFQKLSSYETAPERKTPEYEAVNETGTPIRKLLETYIDNGMPVIFWACIDMREPVMGPEWRLTDTGETFMWISNEHCMLLVGYDETGYYFNDPYENHGVVRYPKELTELRHEAQYSMAVGVRRIKREQM